MKLNYAIGVTLLILGIISFSRGGKPAHFEHGMIREGANVALF